MQERESVFAFIRKARWLFLVLGACAPAPPPSPVRCLEDVALGEMQEDSAVVWAREEEYGFLHLFIPAISRGFVAPFLPTFDHTARVILHFNEKERELLEKNPHLIIWASFSPENNEAPPPQCAARRLRLPPSSQAFFPFRIAFSADIGGQNLCRLVRGGFPTLAKMGERPHDARILLGDLIYVDEPCEQTSVFGDPQIPFEPPLGADLLDLYRARWQYAEKDEGYRRLRWGSYVIWDDHEVVNDADPHSARWPGPVPSPMIFPIARRAFLEHHPFPMAPDDLETPLYRAVKWGSAIEILILDTRSHRDPNRALDSNERPKSLLGSRQRQWLIERINQSTARWLVIATTVPFGVPTGGKGQRDGWADGGSQRGRMRELLGILDALRRSGRTQLLVISADLHTTLALRYRPFPEDPRFEVIEIVVGPLSALLFPRETLESRLNPELLFSHYPLYPPTTLEEALPYFTWGELEAENPTRLIASIWNASGQLWSIEVNSP
ncbi:MAG: alkaline phosphatase D family protein [Sandaracinaceae bacterium]|nr:alkaline phosphatase D family protein [Sandaracinaceae bacterium]